MASGTVVRNGLAIGARMTAIMAAEAARRIDVPKVTRVCPPRHTHVGEDVAQVDIRHFLAGLLHCGAPRSTDFRVIGPIKAGYLASDGLLSYFASGVIPLKRLDRFFPDVRKIGAYPPDRHLLVYSIFRQVRNMRGPVVAIQAIHHAMFSLVQ